jgi:hypothetical protein
MSDIINSYSDYVRFILKSDNASSFILTSEPGGWRDDELELQRNKKYHGIFTKFSSKLEFYKEAKDYIIRAYTLGGINTKLTLTKQITKDVLQEDGTYDVKWVERYNALADFNTMVYTNTTLEIKFNDNDLTELIKSHESDEFELERIDSIDEVPLDDMYIGSLKINGRDIVSSGEQVINLDSPTLDSNGVETQSRKIPDNGYISANTNVVSQGNERNSPCNLIGSFDESNPTSGDATDAMWYIDSDVDLGETDITFEYDIEFSLKEGNGTTTLVRLDLVRYKWNGSGYDEVTVTTLFDYTSILTPFFNKQPNITGSVNIPNLDFDEGLVFRWKRSGSGNYSRIRFYKHNIKFGATETYLETSNHNFTFVHDAFERIMYIITGRKNAFYSKYFGRTELGYAQDGLDSNGKLGGGLISLIHGFWIRKFDKKSSTYKSLTTSFKKLIDSCSSIFNVGMGIETVNFEQRVRVEELKYFYRDSVSVRLPFQISKEKRKVDTKLFFSALNLGYDKGGDYENEIGLDEPNTKTNWITPIRKSKNKYNKVSKFRSDEYGLELARRLPQELFPEEDSEYDDQIWFLDLTRDESVPFDSVFRQVQWQDRLDEEPNGILSPNTFRSMIFTPIRILFRHGWVIRSGLEVYLDKTIKYISSIANTTLSMKFFGEEEIQENSDIFVNNLERSRFLPEIIEFEHPVNEDLIDKVFGKTKIFENGDWEDVQNYYFKMEWINEDGNTETGYLLSLKPKGVGKWVFQKANENII